MQVIYWPDSSIMAGCLVTGEVFAHDERAGQAAAKITEYSYVKDIGYA